MECFMPYFALIITFYHVKIACYQHSSCGILSLFPPLFFSLMRWISIARSSFVFFFFPFSFHLSASPSFFYDKNIPVTRRGKSLLFIIFSPYFFFLPLPFSSLRRSLAGSSFFATSLVSSRPCSSRISSSPSCFLPSKKEREKRR